MKFIQGIKHLFAAAMLALAASAPAHATLAGTYDTVLYFSGTCTDCVGTVTGKIWFTTYTVDKRLDRSHFFGFSYSGSNLLAPFSIDGDGQPGTSVYLKIREDGLRPLFC